MVNVEERLAELSARSYVSGDGVEVGRISPLATPGYVYTQSADHPAVPQAAESLPAGGRLVFIVGSPSGAHHIAKADIQRAVSALPGVWACEVEAVSGDGSGVNVVVRKAVSSPVTPPTPAVSLHGGFHEQHTIRVHGKRIQAAEKA
jgi:hypothetical protein